MAITIAIADDHPLVLNGLQNVLRDSKTMKVINVYANGSELLEGLTKNVPDVLLLDIQMPGKQGDELAKIISRKYPDIKIIALTNLENVYFIKSMFQAGVMGYVLKTAREDVLLEAIHTVYDGNQFLEARLREQVMQHTLSSGHKNSETPLLTQREKEVLQLIAANHTSREIAEMLFLSKRTIDHHRNSILLKLDVKNTAGLIKKAITLGLIE